MSALPYNLNVPNGPNNPSADQSLMQTNTNSIATFLDVNHIDFSQSNFGKHAFVEMPKFGSTPTTLSGEGSLFTASTNASAGNPQETGLIYTPDNSTDTYQLTTTSSNDYALFSHFSIGYNGNPNTFTGGWTFLPGGIFYQYGTATINTGVNIPFPLEFTAKPYIVMVNGFYNNTSRGFFWVMTTSNTGFTAAVRDSSGNDILTTINWFAIGK
jgi:hypothetical protein